MPLPLPLLSNMLFQNEQKLRRMLDSGVPHERWMALAAAGEEAQLRQELNWAHGNPGAYPFARTQVPLDVDHNISATSAALLAGELGCLKILVLAQRLPPHKMGALFEDVAWVLQRNQTDSPYPVLMLSEDQKDCLAWLMHKGLELRDHLPSLLVHERTSGGTLLKRTGEGGDRAVVDVICKQAEQVLDLYKDLRERQQSFAPDEPLEPWSPEAEQQEGWNLIGHVFLRWRVAEQARKWLQTADELPCYGGTRQPSYLVRNLRHRDLVEDLLDRGASTDPGAITAIVKHLRNDQASRTAQWRHGHKPRNGVDMTPYQHTRLLEQELEIQQTVIDVMDLVERYHVARSREAWPSEVVRVWNRLREEVEERKQKLDEEALWLLAVSMRAAYKNEPVTATVGGDEPPAPRRPRGP